MKKMIPLLATCMMFSASQLAAQNKPQTPSISVDGKASSEVYLQKLDIKVDVTGNVATTKMTMTFKNRTGKVLEGELLFPLPDGVTVSHYALDINGKMREAVPVEKAKATQVFEEIVHRRVDPGLLERVEGNNFRTRIYPIPANGTRTISIGYEQELLSDNNRLRYRLPMDYKEAIDELTLKATVWMSKEKPQMDEQLLNELQFDQQGNTYVATVARKNFSTPHMLAFSLPAPTDVPQVFLQSASGSYYFSASCYPKAEARKKEWSNQLAIIWDASLSGEKRDTKRELELLDMLIKEKSNLSISLYLLNNTFKNAGAYQITGGDWSSLRKAIEEVTYDGGTNFSAIELYNIPAQEILFFTDGLSTLSDADFIVPLTAERLLTASASLRSSNLGRPIHCIVSAPRADYSTTKWIAAQTNGKFINLNGLTPKQAQNELMNETLQFIGVKKTDNISEVYPSVSMPVQGNFSVAGIMEGREGEVTLQFGFGGKATIEKKVSLNGKNASEELNVHRFWAQKKIAELDMCYEKNKEELKELGQEFGIVTRNTSLMVLETLQDYITYNIMPPAELREEFMRWQKGQRDQWQQQQQDMLQQAKYAAADLKQWWNTDFAPKKTKYPKPDRYEEEVVTTDVDQEIAIMEDRPVFRQESRVADSRRVRADQSQMAPPPPSAKQLVADESIMDVAYAVKEDTGDFEESKELNGSGTSSRNKQQQPVIKLAPIKQDSQYLKGLTGKLEDDYKKYLEIRPEYVGTPTFFFDMADWFFRHNDKEKALRILTCIADMDVENASLYRLLGYRFKEYGEYKLEAFVCKKVVEWRPMEPQSYRDYALALADDERYQEALDALYSVLTQSYSQHISGNSAGIEEVVVSEINQLVSLYSKKAKLKTEAIDKELLKDMPVDIRVVINWNMNYTDIDLHLTDPNGERCFYGNKETAIGGRISQDITQGYGPEQFMLKKAIKGSYKVFINYFGDSQVKAEGPSTIMAEIFTGYATGKQERKVVCLQLSKEVKQNGDGLVLVAEFEF